jgi:SAM-dependent methyltransferase
MTRPDTLDMSFDTSLVDMKANASFSTTESDPSDFGTPITAAKKQTTQPQSLFEEHSQKTPQPSQTVPQDSASPLPKSSTPVQHIGTQEAYNQWATVYDTDGNMLQAIDDIELAISLPQFLQQVLDSTNTPTISLLDLGCGTGRNTVKLLSSALPPGRQSTVSGLDFSKGMLDIAAEKIRAFNDGQDSPRVKLAQCDCFPTVNGPSASPLPSVPSLSPVNGIISTLVLEHVPLADYFSTLSSLLLPDGIALVTNMHHDMGAKSQAGFVNAQGVKVRGSSFAHSVQDTIEAAQRAGLEVLNVKEREMRREDVEGGRVGERGLKWVGVKVWYGIIVKRVI